jgi:hypothetical protein
MRRAGEPRTESTSPWDLGKRVVEASTASAPGGAGDRGAVDRVRRDGLSQLGPRRPVSLAVPTSASWTVCRAIAARISGYRQTTA